MLQAQKRKEKKKKVKKKKNPPLWLLIVFNKKQTEIFNITLMILSDVCVCF